MLTRQTVVGKRGNPDKRLPVGNMTAIVPQIPRIREKGPAGNPVARARIADKGTDHAVVLYNHDTLPQGIVPVAADIPGGYA
jgi:hypothetical protein